MARLRSLSDGEISLVKRMLIRGMRNNEIQFYFNTPERPVNNGRISEIKSGFNGIDVDPSSDEDLDLFINRHPQTLTIEPDTKLAPPLQSTSGAIFYSTEEGKIDLAATESDANDSVEEAAILSEIRSKSTALLALGHNVLGPTFHYVEELNTALGYPFAEKYILAWSKGNWLRQFLRIHDSVNAEDNPMGSVSPACAEMLRDLVQTFNILAALSAPVAALDQASFGPDDPAKVKAAVSDLSNTATDLTAIASADAAETVNTLIGDTLSMAPGVIADRSTRTAAATVYNFFLTALKGAYRIVARETRETLENALRQGLKGLKGLIVAYASTVAVGQYPELLIFLNQNAPAIGRFIEAVSGNPISVEMIRLISTIF